MNKGMTTPRIADIFENCHSEKRAAVMPFLTAGFPSDNTFVRILEGMVRGGADMVEIGIPFSDPLADGKSIQRSSEAALANGMNIDKALQLAQRAVNGKKTPLILMSYINPILAYGPDRLLRNMYRSGFRGLIIPDLVLEEGGEMERLCRNHRIDLIYLLAPTSTKERQKRIVRRTSGFLYLVSVAGVTGARKTFPKKTHAWIRRVRRESPLPVCVGFGISSLQQAKTIAQNADGVIVGSVLVDIIGRESDEKSMVSAVERFVARLRKQM